MTELYQNNITCLQKYFPSLASSVEQTAPLTNINFIRTKTGKISAELRSSTGSTRLLHSRYDPEREADKLHSEQAASAYMFVLGIACGYHIIPYLNDPCCQKVVVIEENLSIFRSVIEHLDITPIIKHGKVEIFAGALASELQQALLNSFRPYLYKTVGSITHPSADSEYYHHAKEIIRNVIDTNITDMRTMQRFGKRWFHNILHNIFRIPESSARQQQSASNAQGRGKTAALILAAGPSLEAGCKQLDPDTLLCAVDSALPFLLAAGISPDIVISIDCQIHSRLHFRLFPQLSQSTVYLDITSPPCLSRMLSNTIFFASGHPLARLIAVSAPSLIPVDTQGRNVSTAAASLLKLLGHKIAGSFGTDFSYLPGKPYARESYVYKYFSQYETRLESMEQSITRLILQDPETRLVKDTRGNKEYTQRYYTPLLSAYEQSFNLAISKEAYCPMAPMAGSKDFSPLKWLQWYRNSLESLEHYTDDSLISTLIPYMLWQTAHIDDELSINKAIERTISTKIDYIDSVLRR